MSRTVQRGVAWPGGHRFAFSVFDDTDWSTVRSAGPVYDLLDDLDLRVTKSVWLNEPGPQRTTGGSTCEDRDYLRWVEGLAANGHEIGYHHATDRSSTRAETLAALDRFEALFGAPPRVGADHAGNRESLYGGSKRLSGHRAAVYRGVERWKQPDRPRFEGEDPSSPYFWGDVAWDRIDYWRSFSFARTNLVPVGPVLHHDPARPLVRQWFTSSHGPRHDDVIARLAPAEVERLDADGGVCIMYVHFGLDFVDDRGRPTEALVSALTRLRSLDGWFVPVSDLLDHVRDTDAVSVLDRRSRARLERTWILDRVRSRSPLGPSVPTHPGDLDP